MAKKMTIAEKMEKLEKELKRAQAFETVLNRLNEHLQYSLMDTLRDEDGNRVEGEDGDWIWVEPSKDSYRYEAYIAMKGVIEEIEELI